MANENEAVSWWPVVAANAAGWLAAIGGGIRWVFAIRDAQQTQIAAMLTAHRDETRAEMKTLWDKYDDHERVLRNVPTKDDLARLRGEIREDLRLLLRNPGHGG